MSASCHPSCSPCPQLYAIYRHGTRYPSLKYIQKWDSFQALLREKLSSPELPPLKAKQLQAWVNPFTKDHAVVQITEKGMLEHYCLARRLQKRLSIEIKHRRTSSSNHSNHISHSNTVTSHFPGLLSHHHGNRFLFPY